MFESMDLPEGDLEEEVAAPVVAEIKEVKT